MVEREFPHVNFVQFKQRRTIPELRGIGVSMARGDIIAITEDHCVAPADWFERILENHQGDHAAVGGAIENAQEHGLVNWASFLCEYLPHINPVPRGECWNIPGNNVAYKREALDPLRPLLEGGFWEAFLHEKLRENGHRIISTPDLVMNHKKAFGFWEFMGQRFHYGRSFAGMRNETCSPAKRLYYLVFSPFLPPLLVFRMFTCVRKKRRYAGRFVVSLPLLFLFTIASSLGEFIGHAIGPGNSLLKVE